MTLHLLDHHRSHWLVEGIMNETIKEEHHDQHPGAEESQKVLPA
jgi:hypothetical protein